MRELLFKALTSLESNKRDFRITETIEKDGVRAETIGQPPAACRNPVDIRRSGDSAAVRADRRGGMVVGHDKQDIGTPAGDGCAYTGGVSRENGGRPNRQCCKKCSTVEFCVVSPRGK